jgi:hypothetical protein
VIKLGGYIFTIFYLAGSFFPSSFQGMAGQLSQISGHLAFSLFALLIARGARRTSNHFFYFVRLLSAAIATELILHAAAWKFDFYLADRNPLFTFAASLALIAGISMAVGCYHDLVANAVPAGGELDRKILFGVPVNPGNYRIGPATGIILGLATAGLSLFVSLYFDFAYGIYGLLYILLSFIAMREDPGTGKTLVRDSIFTSRTEYLRTLIYLTTLAAVAFLLSFAIKSLRPRIPLTYLATLAIIPIASILPERPRLAPGIRRLLYLSLPVFIGLFFLLRLWL